MSWVSTILDMPDARRPTLVDGGDEVSSSAWGQRVDAVRQAIDATGLRAGDAVAFACEQTVGDVLLLLVLLERRLTVIVQPAPSPQPPAPFCRGTVRWRDGLEFRSIDDRPSGRIDTEPLLIARTSGSLGEAKLVAHEPGRMLANARAVIDRLRLDSDVRMSVPVPIWHMYGLGAALLPGLLTGATIDLIAQANALRFFDRERRFAPTVAYLTPSFAASLVRARRAPRSRPYRFCVCAGDRTDPATFEAWEDCSGALVQLYGTTELGAVAAAAPDTAAAVRATSVGLPLDGVECGLDDAGVLRVRSRYAFLGYVDAAGAIAPADDWFTTGDRAQVDAGRIAILGRADLAVNRDGRLMQLEELERLIERLDGVERAAVVPEGHGGRGVGLVAFIAGRAADDASALRAVLRSSLPEWAVPEQLCAIDRIPMLPNGKLDRPALAALARVRASHR